VVTPSAGSASSLEDCSCGSGITCVAKPTGSLFEALSRDVFLGGIPLTMYAFLEIGKKRKDKKGCDKTKQNNTKQDRITQLDTTRQETRQNKKMERKDATKMP
jgi:hypothetical protein